MRQHVRISSNASRTPVLLLALSASWLYRASFYRLPPASMGWAKDAAWAGEQAGGRAPHPTRSTLPPYAPSSPRRPQPTITCLPPLPLPACCCGTFGGGRRAAAQAARARSPAHALTSRRWYGRAALLDDSMGDSAAVACAFQRASLRWRLPSFSFLLCAVRARTYNRRARLAPLPAVSNDGASLPVPTGSTHG